MYTFVYKCMSYGEHKHREYDKLSIVIYYDYMAYMDYMDPDVLCPKKADRLYQSFTHYYLNLGKY